MKSEELKVQQRTDTDESPLDATPDDLLLISGFDREKQIPVTVEPGPNDLQTVQQVITESPASALIKPMGLVIAPSRDARYKPSPELTKAVLDRIAERTVLARAKSSTLVLVAHPDDEAIGAGGLLAGMPDAVIAHVTDGAPRDDKYAQAKGFPTRESYARARRREVVNALAHVGITPERCRGLGYVDGEASLQLIELVFDVADLMNEVRPEIVITHPYEGGHSDHDATAFAVHLACGVLRRDNVPTPLVLELTSYHNFSGQRRVFSFLPFLGTDSRTIQLTENEKILKSRMYGEFLSQKVCLERFPIAIERFRPAPRYQFTAAPHEGPLDYERYCTVISGAEWRDNAGKALQTLRTRRRRFVQALGLTGSAMRILG
ncbi:MAG TPA: PIG-L family deacetylase [Gemmatimonadaceae bacterium]|nr:PIG-L family deacetylase [Gemmatimonadaceae bacterium]